MTAAATLAPSGACCAGPDPRPCPTVWLVDSFCFTPWYTAELALAVQGAGLPVRLIANGFSREPKFFHRLGLHPDAGSFRLSPIFAKGPAICHRAVRTAEVLLSQRRLQRAMRREAASGPQVLHLQQTPMLQHGLRADLSLVDAAHSLGISVVHTVHNLLPHDSGSRLHGVFRELYHRVDHLICHSPDAARDLAALFGVPERKISVIPHGPLFAPKRSLAAADVNAARQELGLPEGRRIVLWQGVLAPYKGLDILSNAWKLCVRRCADQGAPLPLLVIAGSGSARLIAQVGEAASQLGDSVRTDLYYIASDRLPLFYAAADILVYPYRAITTSGALLTGLSYEKPIVASRLDVFQEFLTDGENALLVEPGDATALAECLFTLVQDPILAGDPADLLRPGPAYERIAHGARQNRNRCTSWTEIGRRTAALYCDLAQTAFSRGSA